FWPKLPLFFPLLSDALFLTSMVTRLSRVAEYFPLVSCRTVRVVFATIWHPCSASTTNSSYSVLCLLSMKKRRANKLPCPFGTGMRLGCCHNRKLNMLREKLGRGWFSSLLHGAR